MLKLPSLTLITQKLALAAKRFPISLLLILGFGAALFNDNLLLIFFFVGIIISTVAVLWLEDFVSYAKRQIITLSITSLWGIYCFFLPERMNRSTGGEFFAIGLAVLLSILFTSSLKKYKDKAFFSIRIIFQICLVLAILFGAVIFVQLYVTDMPYKMSLMNIYFALFASIVHFSDKVANHSEEISLNKFLKILAYILMPLAAIYAIILYIYLIKIIFTLDLPKGDVSYLVSALAFSGLFIITLLYPARLEGSNKFIISLSRYFGLIILPLLVLMTAGILRRINDYGVTINRCYVLLLNIWFYGIYIYLFIKKAKNIKWIPISFAAIALFFSIGFWGIPSVTKRILIADLKEYLSSQKIFLSEEEDDKILDKVKYLRRNYGMETTYLWVDEIQRRGGFNAFVYIPGCYDKDKVKCHFGNSYNKFTIEVIPDNRTFSIVLKENTIIEKKIIRYDDYIVLVDEFSKDFEGYVFYNK
jgi:hypothetical protein